MARAIEQIERDIAALKEAVNILAAELVNAYNNYFKVLGQAIRQQMILASYQICTQGYPKQFLSLSFSQRQQLQQSIRKLGKDTTEQLVNLLQTDLDGGNGGDGELPTNYELTSTPSNPLELAQWQQNIEEAIAYTLKTLSLETNQLLQQSGILPQQLPAPLLEAATTASETAAEITSGPPNVLNLLIETENNSESETASLTQLIAIQLRLSEIEFADAKVRAARNQIRQLEARVNSLGREYQKKQRECIIAEAEAAWRSSWFDE